MAEDPEAETVPDQKSDEFLLIWADSQERQSFNKTRRRILLWTLLTVVLALTFILIANATGAFMPEQRNQIFSLYIPIIVISTMYGIAFVVHTRKKALQRLLHLRLAHKALQKEEKGLAEQAMGSYLELPSLWAATQKRIDFYHEIATSQAERSFKVGQVAAIAGFILVVGVGVAAAFAVSGTASIAAAAVGVAGAAMSGYIGATFMKAQSEASAQLRQFFLQPVEFARLLGAERLINSLPDSHKAAAVQQIVTTMMPSDGGGLTPGAPWTDMAGSADLKDAAENEKDAAQRSKWPWLTH